VKVKISKKRPSCFNDGFSLTVSIKMKCLQTVFQENYRALADDVHVVEESLAMVDDCFKLLDNSKKINVLNLVTS